MSGCRAARAVRMDGKTNARLPRLNPLWMLYEIIRRTIPSVIALHNRYRNAKRILPRVRSRNGLARQFWSVICRDSTQS